MPLLKYRIADPCAVSSMSAITPFEVPDKLFAIADTEYPPAIFLMLIG